MLKTYYELHEDFRVVSEQIGVATIDDYVNEYFKVGCSIDTRVIAKFDNADEALKELENYNCDNPNWYFIREIIVDVNEDGEEIDTNQGEFFYAFASTDY